MKRKAGLLVLLAAATVGTVAAQEGAVPKGIPRLDHVFVIMMENHAYAQVIGNPTMPFCNSYAKNVNSHGISSRSAIRASLTMSKP